MSSVHSEIFIRKLFIYTYFKETPNPKETLHIDMHI